MRYSSKINRGRNGKKSIVEVAQAADEERHIQRTGSEATCCKIQVRIFQFKPIDLQKSKFSPSEIFIWLGRSFMLSENEVLKRVC